MLPMYTANIRDKRTDFRINIVKPALKLIGTIIRNTRLVYRKEEAHASQLAAQLMAHLIIT